MLQGENMYIIANWKMNGDKKFVHEYMAHFSRLKIIENAEVILCPPSIFLGELFSYLPAHLKMGAQDCHYEENGAFTGDIGASMIREFGADYVIIGHSERRQYHHETSEIVAKKALNAHKNSLKAIICIGETEVEKNQGKTAAILKEQLSKSLPSTANPKNTIIAYEPIWSIGTGFTPSCEDIEIAAEIIAITQMPVLYGGSVNPANARDIMECRNISGLLIGGCSIDINKFSAILEQIPSCHKIAA